MGLGSQYLPGTRGSDHEEVLNFFPNNMMIDGRTER